MQDDGSVWGCLQTTGTKHTVVAYVPPRSPAEVYRRIVHTHQQIDGRKEFLSRVGTLSLE